MLENFEKRISEDYHKIVFKLKRGRKKLKEEIKKNKEIASELRSNAEEALMDLKSGRVFSDDEAAKNLKNTLTDSLKVAGMTGIFILPGGSVGLVALRKLLRSKEAKSMGIEKLLTLTIEEAKKHEREETPEESKIIPSSRAPEDVKKHENRE